MRATDLPPSDAAAPTPSEQAADADVALYYGFVDALVHLGASGAAERFLADDFVAHDGAAVRSRGEFVARYAARHARHPDAVWTIELLASIGGLVICHTTMTSLTVPTSPDRPIGAWETVVVRMGSGRIAECWCACDDRLRAADAW